MYLLERTERLQVREYVIENEFVKAVRAAGGVAYKLTSQTANGLPDRLVLFFPAKTIFVELKAPGKMLRPLQRKRRYQLMKLGFTDKTSDQGDFGLDTRHSFSGGNRCQNTGAGDCAATIRPGKPHRPE